MFLGKYCWDDATPGEPIIRTFKTRDLGRSAAGLLGTYGSRPRVVSVVVTVTESAKVEGTEADIGEAKGR